MRNDLAGVWRLHHMNFPTGQRNTYGAAPDGLLTLTEDLHFSAVLVGSDLPHVASGDRMTASDEENRAIARGSIGLYGTYGVDADDASVELRVLGSTNPNLTGRTLGPGTLTISVAKHELTMTSSIVDLPVGSTSWERVGTAGANSPGNQVAAAWRMQSAKVEADGQTNDIFGTDPSGSLIFTDGLYFTDVLHRSNIPPFADDDPLRGTDDENRRVVQGSLIVFGSYTVDEDGVFRDEVVLGSSMPNWKGMRRDTSSLTETVRGDLMSEHLDDGDGAIISIEFSRALSA
jgi:hypothetical protein